jgi:TonB family protein
MKFCTFLLAAFLYVSAALAQIDRNTDAERRCNGFYIEGLEMLRTPGVNLSPERIRWSIEHEQRLKDGKACNPYFPAPKSNAAVKRRNAVPLGDPQKWISEKDYPERARLDQVEGVVRFRLTVDEGGRAKDCGIVSSSGNKSLDEATCSLIMRRSRFEPVKDPIGQPVDGLYENSVRWKLQ